jgi:phage/plasmid-associated DNA primase
VETIGDDEKDPALPAKLKAELPGILAWAVRGCLEWQRDGLKPPEVVKAATDVYRAEQDVLAAFLDECCVLNRRAEVKAADIYEAYTEWCDRTGEYAEKQRKFGESLAGRGFERFTNNGVRYRGLGLLATFTEGTEGTEPNSPKTHREEFSWNYRQSGSVGSVGSVTCLSCAHWSDRCGAGFTASDPNMARLCGHFVARATAGRKAF